MRNGNFLVARMNLHLIIIGECANRLSASAYTTHAHTSVGVCVCVLANEWNVCTFDQTNLFACYCLANRFDWQHIYIYYILYWLKRNIQTHMRRESVFNMCLKFVIGILMESIRSLALCIRNPLKEPTRPYISIYIYITRSRCLSDHCVVCVCFFKI